VLWRCWLGGRKGIRPVKNWAVGCWCGCLSVARCRLAYSPADATATHSKIQTGFTFLVLAQPGSPGQRAVKRVCVCVLPVSSWVVKCKTCHTQHSSVMHQLYWHLLTGDSPNEQGLQRRRKENYTLLHYYLLFISTNIFIQHLLYLIINKDNWVTFHSAFSALTLLAEWQEGHPACKNWVLGCWHGYLSGASCRLAYVPADATATHCFLLQ